MGVRRAQDIQAQITRSMDLLERGLNAGLVGDAEAEGAAWEGRTASRCKEEDEAVARIYHYTLFSGKLRQAVRQATNRKEGGCFLPYNQCTKTG